MRPGPAWQFALLLTAASACTNGPSDAQRQAEVERRLAEAEGPAGAAPAASSPAPLAVTRAGEPDPPPAFEPPSPALAAWAASVARGIEALDPRSRQLLSVHLLRAANDPRQKSEELVAHMQWCDEGSLEACLHVAHVLLFNECLFDRARAFCQKAGALAEGLPAAAVDQFTVDGQPQRQELLTGMRFSDPARRDEEQVRALAAVCGAAAERDRALWDDMFARYASGALTQGAVASTSQERLALGAIRKKMLLEAQERVAAVERVHAASGRELHARLAAAAGALCADEDPLSCGTASFLYAAACRFDQMEDAYRRYQAGLLTLDAPSRQQATGLMQEVLGPARGYASGDGRMRELLRRSLCGG